MNLDQIIKFHILNSVLLSLLQFDSLETKIQARSSCQLILSIGNGHRRAWDEGVLKSIGFTSIPGEIKTSREYGDISKIYLKHLKPVQKLDKPRKRVGSAVFVM